MNNVGGRSIRTWDSRGHDFRAEYDRLRRPTARYVLGTDAINSDQRTLASEVQFAATFYGEGQPNDTALNLRTRVFQRFDSASVLTNIGHNPDSGLDEGYDFKGNLLRGSHQLVRDYKSLPDWAGAPPSLDPPILAFSREYDALNRVISVTSPDGSVCTVPHTMTLD